MATQFKELDRDIIETAPRPQPKLALIQDGDFYDEIERTVPGVATRGIHPTLIVAVVGCYAALLTSFWIFFARDAEAALVMAMVTVLMMMYFALLAGGILVADAPAPGEVQRSLREFLRGPVETLTEVVTGRQAAVQMLLLPALMVVLATVIGAISRIALLV